MKGGGRGYIIIYLPNVSGSFFSFFLSERYILGRNKAQRKEKRWSSYAVSVRMSIARLTVAWLAGAKVDDISMQSKYIYHFFYSFLKQFCN